MVKGLPAAQEGREMAAVEVWGEPVDVALAQRLAVRKVAASI